MEPFSLIPYISAKSLSNLTAVSEALGRADFKLSLVARFDEKPAEILRVKEKASISKSSRFFKCGCTCDHTVAQAGHQGFSIPTYHQNWCPFLFLKTCLLHVKITRILLCIQFQLCTRGNFGLWSHTDGPTHRRTMLNCSLIFSHLHTSGFLSKNNLYKTGIMIDQMSQLTCKVDQNENLCKLSKSILCKDLLCLFP